MNIYSPARSPSAHYRTRPPLERRAVVQKALEKEVKENLLLCVAVSQSVVPVSPSRSVLTDLGPFYGPFCYLGPFWVCIFLKGPFFVC